MATLRDAIARIESGESFVLVEGQVPGQGRVALFPGTFGPPTVAHVAVAEAALAHAGVVVLAVPGSSVGKEGRGGLEERLTSVASVVRGRRNLAAALVADGLYVDLAEAAARRFGRGRVDIVLGSDKLGQILDPAYYPGSRVEAVLDRLLEAARLLVAPRAGVTLPVGVQGRVLEGAVLLDVPAEYHAISSSEVRRLVGEGRDVSHLTAGSATGGLRDDVAPDV